MLGAGIFLSLLGLVGVIYGFAQRSSAEYLLASAFGSEEATTVDAILYIGLAALVIGILLLCVHYSKKNKQ